MKITLDNMDKDDGSVTVYCDDQEAALHDQTIEGSRWEAPGDMNVAYACIMDRIDLLEVLKAEGYEVDDSEYVSPTQEDLDRAHQKYVTQDMDAS